MTHYTFAHRRPPEERMTLQLGNNYLQCRDSINMISNNKKYQNIYLLT